MKNLTVAISIALAALMVSPSTGCSGDQPKGDETSGDTVAVIPAPSAPVDTAPAAGEVKTYDVHGTVTAIDQANNMITLDHEQIGDYMEAMTMPFKVADPALLTQVKVGDKGHFELRVAGDQALITKVEKGDHDH